MQVTTARTTATVSTNTDIKGDFATSSTSPQDARILDIVTSRLSSPPLQSGLRVELFLIDLQERAFRRVDELLYGVPPEDERLLEKLILKRLPGEERCVRQIINAFLGLQENKKDVVDQLTPFLDICTSDSLVVKLLNLFNTSQERRETIVDRLNSLAPLVRSGDLDNTYLEKCFLACPDRIADTLPLLWPVPLFFLKIPGDQIIPNDIVCAKKISYAHRQHEDVVEATESLRSLFLKMPGSYRTRIALMNILSTMPEREKEPFLEMIAASVSKKGVTDEVLSQSIWMFRLFTAEDRTQQAFDNCVAWCNGGGYIKDQHQLLYGVPLKYPELVEKCAKIAPYLERMAPKDRELVGDKLMQIFAREGLDQLIALMETRPGHMQHGELIHAAELWSSFPKESQTEENFGHCLKLFKGLSFIDQGGMLSTISKVTAETRLHLVQHLSFFCREDIPFECKFEGRKELIRFYLKSSPQRVDSLIEVVKSLPEESKKEQVLIPAAIWMLRFDKNDQETLKNCIEYLGLPIALDSYKDASYMPGSYRTASHMPNSRKEAFYMKKLDWARTGSAHITLPPAKK